MIVAVIIIGVALIIAIAVIVVASMEYKDSRAKRDHEYALRELDTKEDLAKAAMRYGVMKSKIRDISTYSTTLPRNYSGSADKLWEDAYREGAEKAKKEALEIIEQTERGER